MTGDVAARFPAADKTLLGYLPVYGRLAGEIGPGGHVLEIGVRGGESLEMWQALFPEGLVAGVDNHAEGRARWPEGTVPLLFDQDDPILAKMAAGVSPAGWDLIVDDASHDGKLTRATWELLWPLVKPGGWYVIEDWWLGYLPWAAEKYGDSMLRLAESFLPMLGDDPHTNNRFPAGIDVLEYRPGQAIIHRVAG